MFGQKRRASGQSRAAVIIERVEIENYRSVKHAVVDLGNLTAVLGKNGVGKSTLLYALESFYNPGFMYTNFDYYNHNSQDCEISIQVTFGSLRQDELKEFGSYVQNAKLTVTKVANAGGSRYYGATPQIPDFVEVRKLTGREKTASYKALVDTGTFPGLGKPPTRAAEVDPLLDEYETAHPEQTQLIRREQQFLGAKNVGGGKLDSFTRFVLVPAVRDAANETERKGVVAQLIELIVERKLSNREDFRAFKQTFADQAKELFRAENMTELQEFGELISSRLQRYAPGAELSVDFTALIPPDIKLPSAVVSVSDDKLKVPIRYTGHGLQRALILALLEQLAQTAAPTAEDKPETAQNDGKSEPEAEAPPPPRPPDLILAIEEPELYLHPNRNRFLSTILQQLSQPPADTSLPRTQTIYVTHSPYFVDINRFDDVRIARKELFADRPGITHFKGYTRLAAAQRLAQILKKDPAQFTAESFSTRCGHLLTALVNEGFFADAVVVVEGVSDAAAIDVVQRALKLHWEERGIVVVAAGGKNNIDRIAISVSGFGIPTYFLFDGDASDKDKENKKQNAERNQTLLALGGGAAEDFPASGVHPGYAVFNDCLETELEGAWGKEKFLKIRDAAASDCQADKPSKALKNPDVMTAAIGLAYAGGDRVPILEALVRQVDVLLK